MKKTVKLIIIIFIILMSLLLTNHYVKAASTSFWAKNETVEEGDTITVTAEVVATQWNLEIKVNGKTIASSYELNNYKGNITKTFSGTYEATKTGTVTFSLEGDITDYDQTNSNVDKSISVTVKEKEAVPKPSFEDTNQTVYATTDGVNVRSSYSTNSSIIGSLKAGESVKRTGIGSNGWSKVSYNGSTAYISSDYLTTTKPEINETKDDENKEDNKENEDKKEEKSNNNSLKILEVVPDGLKPRFDPNETDYTLTVGSNIAALNINAVADDEKAKVEIKGNKDLKLGENTIDITVTAEDGTKKEYKIVVLKEEIIQLGLKELLIEGLPLTPEFSEEIYEYTLNLDKSDISELNITALASRESATVEIIGNAELKPGKNIITILVVDGEDEEQETVTYQVTVNLPILPEESLILGRFTETEFYKYMAIILGGIVILILLIMLIKKIIRRKDSVEEEEEDIDLYHNDLKEELDDSNIDNLDNKMEELSDEELPHFLRKNQAEKVEEKIEEKGKVEKIEENQEVEKTSSKQLSKEEERKNKLDEFTAAVDRDDAIYGRKKRGKHF